MERLLCWPLYLDSGAAVRVGAKADATGADRTTAAVVDATVTNESLILSSVCFVLDFFWAEAKLCARNYVS